MQLSTDCNQILSQGVRYLVHRANCGDGVLYYFLQVETTIPLPKKKKKKTKQLF